MINIKPINISGFILPRKSVFIFEVLLQFIQNYNGQVKNYPILNWQLVDIFQKWIGRRFIEKIVLQTFLPASELSINGRLNASLGDCWVSEDGSRPHNLKQFCLIIWLCGPPSEPQNDQKHPQNRRISPITFSKWLKSCCGGPKISPRLNAPLHLISTMSREPTPHTRDPKESPRCCLHGIE